MQFHQPSLRNRSSSWSEISASNTCLRSMTLYLAYHCTGNLSRGVSVWFRYGRTFKGHGSRNGTLFTSDGSGEGPCASTATSPTMKRNKVSCRDHNSQPRPGESVPALQRRRSSKANPGNSTSPCVASCAKADASETEISRVLVSGSFSTQTQEVLQPEVQCLNLLQFCGMRCGGGLNTVFPLGVTSIVGLVFTAICFSESTCPSPIMSNQVLR